MQIIIFLDNNIQINVDSDKYQVYSIDKHIIDIQNTLHGNTYTQVNTDNSLSRNDDEDIKRRYEERYALKLGFIESAEESF